MTAAVAVGAAVVALGAVAAMLVPGRRRAQGEAGADAVPSTAGASGPELVADLVGGPLTPSVAPALPEIDVVGGPHRRCQPAGATH
jgi:hypothetical protein